MKILRFDHMVLTVQSLDKSIDFYCRILGMEHVTFGDNRHAVKFGNQKINLHTAGFAGLVADAPTKGSGDLCFITETPLKQVIEELVTQGIQIELGPLERTGAIGPIQSIYLRDPDRNLLEISNY